MLRCAPHATDPTETMPQHSSRASRRTGAAQRSIVCALGAVAVLSAASPAWAEPPVDLPSDERIVDDSGVLQDPAGLEEQIDELTQDEGITLSVVIVDEFTDAASADEWVEQTWLASGMGSSDALLAVASEDREARFLAGDGGGISLDEQDSIYQDEIVPELSDDDWDGAVAGAVEGLDQAAGGTSGSSDSGDGGLSFSPMLLVLLIGLAAIFVPFVLRVARRVNRQRAGQRQQQGEARQSRYGEFADVPIKELRVRAGEQIVAADNAIQHSEQELEFARLQYSQAQVAPFEEAIRQAKEHMRACFALQQQLDDHIPDTEDDQRSWLTEIIGRTRDAQRPLEEQKEAFAGLRQLETRLPEALAQLKEESQRVRPELDAAAAHIDQLSTRYADSALHPLREDLGQARERLRFADDMAAEAEEAARGDDRSSAVVRLRAGEEGAGQAAGLLRSIREAADGLSAAETGLRDAMALAQRDIAEAESYAGDGSRPDLAAAAAGVRSVLGTIDQQLKDQRIDPVELQHRLDLSRDQLDRTLGGLRTAAEQDRALRGRLDQAIDSARTRVQAAERYIWGNRGGIGHEARTRLANAQSYLERAQELAQSDAQAALDAAQQAEHHAQQALDGAHTDSLDFSHRRSPGSGSYGGAALGGILLGSILDEVMDGSRRGSGGFSGGGFNGGFSGGFGGGGFGGGSFGGGGGRRRSSGGSFGGGGRRSFGGGGRRSSGGRF